MDATELMEIRNDVHEKKIFSSIKDCKPILKDFVLSGKRAFFGIKPH